MRSLAGMLRRSRCVATVKARANASDKADEQSRCSRIKRAVCFVLALPHLAARQAPWQSRRKPLEFRNGDHRSATEPNGPKFSLQQVEKTGLPDSEPTRGFTGANKQLH